MCSFLPDKLYPLALHPIICWLCIALYLFVHSSLYCSVYLGCPTLLCKLHNLSVTTLEAAQGTISLLCVSHCVRQVPRFLSFQAAFQLNSLLTFTALLHCLGLFLPLCMTSHFLLLNAMRFMSGHFSSLSRFFCILSQPLVIHSSLY